MSKNVTVNIEADATKFARTIKSVQSMQDQLGKVTDKYNKSGMKGAKGLEKIQATYNKQQRGAGKEALKHEQQLNKLIKEQISLIQRKQKLSKGNADAIKDEVKQLDRLHDKFQKIQKFRKSVGVKSFGERAGGIGSALGRGAGMAGMAVLGVGASIATGIVSAIVNAVASQITSGYTSYVNYGRSRAALSGMGNPTDAALEGGAQFGFSKTETVQQMHGVGRQTGNINAVTTAQRIARSFGGDVGEISGFMGALTRSGQGFGGRAGVGGEKQITRIMQHAFSSGLDKSRAGEHLSAVAEALQSTQAVTAGKVDASSISALLSFFGRSGQPGLQGAAGLAQLSKIDQGIKSAGFGGGNDPATAMILQAMGFGTPGGTTNFYDATKMAQRGVFGQGGAQNLMNVMSRFSEAGGGANSQETNLMLSRAFGLSLDTVEGIWKAMADSGGDTTKALDEIQRITKQEAPVEDQILDANLEVAKRVAGLENRMIGIGEEFAPHIEKIQDAANKFLDFFIQRAVPLFARIADAVTNIDIQVTRYLGGDKIASNASSYSDAVKKNTPEILNRIFSGDVSKQQLDSFIANQQDKIAHQYDLLGASADTGVTGGILSLFDGGAASADNLRAIMNLSEASARLRGLSAAQALELDPGQGRAAVDYLALRERLSKLRWAQQAGLDDMLGEDQVNSQISNTQTLLSRLESQLGNLANRIVREANRPPTPDVNNPGDARATQVDTNQVVRTSFQ